jgi:putative IMPACT (imprinted ancient) family translation regulator
MISKLILVSNGNISQWRAGSNCLLLSIGQMVFMEGTAGTHTLKG